MLQSWNTKYLGSLVVNGKTNPEVRMRTGLDAIRVLHKDSVEAVSLTLSMDHGIVAKTQEGEKTVFASHFDELEQCSVFPESNTTCNFLKRDSGQKEVLFSFQFDDAAVAADVVKDVGQMNATHRSEAKAARHAKSSKKGKAAATANPNLNSLLERFSPTTSPEPSRRRPAKKSKSPRAVALKMSLQRTKDSAASLGGISLLSTSSGASLMSTAPEAPAPASQAEVATGGPSFSLPRQPSPEDIGSLRAKMSNLDPSILELLFATLSRNSSTVVKCAEVVTQIVTKICEIVPKTLHEGVPLLASNLLAAADCLIHTTDDQTTSRLNAIEHIGLVARQLRDATNDLVGIFMNGFEDYAFGASTTLPTDFGTRRFTPNSIDDPFNFSAFDAGSSGSDMDQTPSTSYGSICQSFDFSPGPAAFDMSYAQHVNNFAFRRANTLHTLGLDLDATFSAPDALSTDESEADASSSFLDRFVDQLDTISEAHSAFISDMVNEAVASVTSRSFKEPSEKLDEGIQKRVQQSRLTVDRKGGENAEPTMTETFMLTYRSFMQAPLLLAKLKELSTDSLSKQAAFLHICAYWVMEYWVDFNDSTQFLETLKDIVVSLQHSGEGEEDASGVPPQCISMLQREIMVTIDLQSEFDANNCPTLPQREGHGPMPGIIIQLDPQTLAEQVTIYNFNLLRRVHPTEFVYYFFPPESQQGDACANLKCAIARFDEESYWVTAEICAHTTAKEQAKMLTKFIQVAEGCLRLGNFYSVFTILGALNFPQVSSKKKAWARISDKAQKSFENLERIMNPSMNMRAYRQQYALLSHTARIPFLALHLKDMLFANEGSSSGGKEGVNVQKLQLLTKFITSVTPSFTYSGITLDAGINAYIRVSTVDPSIPRNQIGLDSTEIEAMRKREEQRAQKRAELAAIPAVPLSAAESSGDDTPSEYMTAGDGGSGRSTPASSEAASVDDGKRSPTRQKMTGWKAIQAATQRRKFVFSGLMGGGDRAAPTGTYKKIGGEEPTSLRRASSNLEHLEWGVPPADGSTPSLRDAIQEEGPAISVVSRARSESSLDTILDTATDGTSPATVENLPAALARASDLDLDHDDDLDEEGIEDEEDDEGSFAVATILAASAAFEAGMSREDSGATTPTPETEPEEEAQETGPGCAITSVSMYLAGPEEVSSNPASPSGDSLMLCHDTSMMPASGVPQRFAADQSLVMPGSRGVHAPRVSSPLASRQRFAPPSPVPECREDDEEMPDACPVNLGPGSGPGPEQAPASSGGTATDGTEGDELDVTILGPQTGGSGGGHGGVEAEEGDDAAESGPPSPEPAATAQAGLQAPPLDASQTLEAETAKALEAEVTKEEARRSNNVRLIARLSEELDSLTTSSSTDDADDHPGPAPNPTAAAAAPAAAHVAPEVTVQLDGVAAAPDPAPALEHGNSQPTFRERSGTGTASTTPKKSRKNRLKKFLASSMRRRPKKHTPSNSSAENILGEEDEEGLGRLPSSHTLEATPQEGRRKSPRKSMTQMLTGSLPRRFSLSAGGAPGDEGEPGRRRGSRASRTSGSMDVPEVAVTAPVFPGPEYSPKPPRKNSLALAMADLDCDLVPELDANGQSPGASVQSTGMGDGLLAGAIVDAIADRDLDADALGTDSEGEGSPPPRRARRASMQNSVMLRIKDGMAEVRDAASLYDCAPIDIPDHVGPVLPTLACLRSSPKPKRSQSLDSELTTASSYATAADTFGPGGGSRSEPGSVRNSLALSIAESLMSSVPSSVHPQMTELTAKKLNPPPTLLVAAQTEAEGDSCGGPSEIEYRVSRPSALDAGAGTEGAGADAASGHGVVEDVTKATATPASRRGSTTATSPRRGFKKRISSLTEIDQVTDI